MQFQGIGDLVVCVGKVVLSGDGCIMYMYLYHTTKDEVWSQHCIVTKHEGGSIPGFGQRGK
jgi:hypothetical protein